jgi:hypothetical protein
MLAALGEMEEEPAKEADETTRSRGVKPPADECVRVGQ